MRSNQDNIIVSTNIYSLTKITKHSIQSTGTAVCVDLAKSERKAVHMNIVMWRASYSGWIEAWPHNFIHVHSFLVLVLQGLRKQLY